MKPNQPSPTDATLATSGQSVAARALRAQEMPEPPGWLDAQILSAAQTEAKVIRDKIAREVPITRRPWFRFGLPALAAATVLVTAYLPQVDVTPAGVRLPEAAQAPAPKTAGTLASPAPAAAPPDAPIQAAAEAAAPGATDAKQATAKPDAVQGAPAKATGSQMPAPEAGKPSPALAERKRAAPAQPAQADQAPADANARSGTPAAASSTQAQPQEKLAGLMQVPPPVAPAPAPAVAAAPAAESAGTAAAAPPALEPRVAAAPAAKKDQSAAPSNMRRESAEAESVTRNFSTARAPAVRDQTAADSAGAIAANNSAIPSGAMPSQAPAKNSDKQSPSEALVREYMAIRALMMESKLDEARERLQRLVRAQPDLVLPADLKALQRSTPAQQTAPQPFPAPSP